MIFAIKYVRSQYDLAVYFEYEYAYVRDFDTCALSTPKLYTVDTMAEGQLGQASAPRTPEHKPPGILVTSNSNYGSKQSIPLAYSVRQATAAQQASPSRNSNTLPSPRSDGYDPSEWTFLGLERPVARSKYIVSLLYRPLMIIYAWPVDPQNPKSRGKCFVTPLEAREIHATQAVLKASLRVLYDVMRCWMNIIRSKPRHQRDTLQWHYIAREQDIEHISRLLDLFLATQQQREEWLRQQIIPEGASLSTASSPLSTPKKTSDSITVHDMIGVESTGSRSVPASPLIRGRDFNSARHEVPLGQANDDTFDTYASNRASVASVPSVTLTEPDMTSVSLVDEQHIYQSHGDDQIHAELEPGTMHDNGRDSGLILALGQTNQEQAQAKESYTIPHLNTAQKRESLESKPLPREPIPRHHETKPHSASGRRLGPLHASVANLASKMRRHKT